MNTPVVLFLSNSALIAFEYRDGQMYERCRFSTEARSVDAYCAFVEELRTVPTSVLVDIVAEEFARENIARVGWSDRKLIVDRALEQQFARTAYRVHRVQGRSPEARARNRVLLAGLTNTDFVARWTTPLVERNVPLRGIYSVPFVQQRLLKSLRLHTGNQLLVSIQDKSALRLSLFTDGHLASSRLALFDATSAVDLAALVSDQVARSRDYLMRGRLLGFTDALHVEVLCGAQLGQVLTESAELDPKVELSITTPVEVARQLPRGVRLNNAERAELLYAATLVTRGDIENYARPSETAVFRRLHVAAQVSLTALAASVLCVAGAVWQVGAGVAVLADQPYVAGRVARANDILATERQLAHRPGYEFADLQEAATLVDYVHRRSPDPYAVAGVVSAALERHAAIEIDALTWGEQDSRPRGRGAPPPARAASDTSVDLAVTGRVVSFEGEFPAAFARIEAFMAALRESPAVTSVTATRMPLNVDIGDNLSGDVERAERAGAVEFELALKVDRPQLAIGATQPDQVVPDDLLVARQ